MHTQRHAAASLSGESHRRRIYCTKEAVKEAGWNVFVVVKKVHVENKKGTHDQSLYNEFEWFQSKLHADNSHPCRKGGG